MHLLSIILLPLAGAWLPPFLKHRARIDPSLSTALLVAAALIVLLSRAPSVLGGATEVVSWAWLPSIGLSLSLRLDGLGLLFALLILGIGLLVILYARYYLTGPSATGRFYAYLLLFMGAMLGIVLSENLILLLMFWELTSLSSFLLIGYWYHRTDARQGARLALMITGGGGIALLAGILLLGNIVGSFELSEVLAAGERIKSHTLYPLILVLVLLGAFTKSAQFPFHFWLPHAMAAPTPVSAYLHSATMVKAGIFLLARLFPVLAGTDDWFFLVGGAGLLTLVFGAYSALFQHDLKGLLAYSTISHLGLITLLLGLGTPLGEIAAVFHIINHAIFKASLFMAAGIIDHEAGTRDMRRLSGLIRYMPYTAVLAMVAAASMAGVPLLNGFLSKEMFFAETLQVQWLGRLYWLLPTLATIAGVFTVAYSARFIHDVFFGPKPQDLPRTPHEPPVWMKFPVEVLVALCLLVGLFPNFTVGPLIDAAAASVLQRELPSYDIQLWHGFGTPLLMSVVALTGGIALYAGRHRLFEARDRYFAGLNGKRITEALVERAFGLARHFTGWLDNGSLQHYMLMLLVTTLAVGTAGLSQARIVGPLALTPVDAMTVLGTVILVIAALTGVIWHRRRLLAVLMLGVVGLLVTLAFVRFSAPDLAMTQLLVEVVTILLLLLAMYFLPRWTPRDSTKTRRARDGLIAIVTGLGAGAATLAMLTRPFESISNFFVENAKPAGGGYNVVNVILVDFRGFDTLGESVVLGVAAVGIFAMLAGMQVAIRDHDWDGRRWASDKHPLVLVVISRPLLPLALLISLYLLLRGHNAPGGGFIAGLVTGVAIILQYLASGTAWAQERLGSDFRWLVAAGVLVAGLTGGGSFLFGYPYLTGTFAYFTLPVIGTFELATALLFDIGIFLAVVGTVLVILATLGRCGPAARDPNLELRE